ncbi:hypothetical protein BRD15_04720 [Halobacteriales archaeon SW_6_65_15]|nr:MAG: hypothetical protein BRD15_04720 [Halobacteriales archaeon SW_6_65_15]
MRKVGVLAVCVLLVLAGCSAAPGNDGGAAAETTEGDDAETETEATDRDSTGSDADLPPGLSTDGVTDAAALAAAHEEALAGQSYTYDREVRVVAANGTEVGGWSQHVQVGADRLEFNHTQTGEGLSVSGTDIEDSQVYTDGSVTFWKADAFRDGFRREPGRGFAAETFSSEQLLADAVNAAETRVTEVEPEGDSDDGMGDGTWYRVRAENGSETLTYDAPNGTVAVEATNVTATAVVAPSGFVRNVTYEFDFVRGNVSGHRTMTVRYSGVGETTVEVPAWVEDAKTVTNATDEN